MAEKRFNDVGALEYITITITEEDRLIRRESQTEGLTYWDNLQVRVAVFERGVTPEETARIAKDRFLGVMARNMAVRDVLLPEAEILKVMGGQEKGLHAILMQAEPGVGKTHEYHTIAKATGWNTLQLESIDAGIGTDGTNLFKEAYLADGAKPSVIARLNAQFRRNSTLSILLAAGADVTARDNQNRTALDMAFEKRDYMTVLKLLVSGADKQGLQSDDGILGLLQYVAQSGLLTFDGKNFTIDAAKLNEANAGVLLEIEKLFLPEQASVPGPSYLDGKLLEALRHMKETGAPLLVNMDEFNYYRQGQTLRAFYSYLNGTDATFSFTDVKGNTLLLTTEDRRNLVIIGSGNEVGKAEAQVQAVSESGESRMKIQPHLLRLKEGVDFADRLSQRIVGFPLIAQLETADAYSLSPEETRALLEKKLTQGLTPDERVAQSNLPLAQALLGNAADVAQALGYVGGFLAELKEILEDKQLTRVLPELGLRGLNKIDGRVFETLEKFWTTELNKSGPQKDADGKIVQKEGKTVYPYRITDKSGKIEEAATPDNIGERVVKGLQLYCAQLFPPHKELDVVKEKNRQIGEALARHRLISLTEARDRYDVGTAAASELNDSGMASLIATATDQPDQLVPALLRGQRIQHAAADIAAATEYLFAIFKRNFPDHAKGMTLEDFQSMAPESVVSAILDSGISRQIEESRPLMPTVQYQDEKVLVQWQPAEAVSADGRKAKGNQLADQAGLGEVLLQTLVTPENAPGKLLLGSVMQTPERIAARAIGSSLISALFAQTVVTPGEDASAEEKQTAQQLQQAAEAFGALAQEVMKKGSYDMTDKSFQERKERMDGLAEAIRKHLGSHLPFLLAEHQKTEAGKDKTTIDLVEVLQVNLLTQTRQYGPQLQQIAREELRRVEFGLLNLRTDAEGKEEAQRTVRVARFRQEDGQYQYLVIGGVTFGTNEQEQLKRAGIDVVNVYAGDEASKQAAANKLESWLLAERSGFEEAAKVAALEEKARVAAAAVSEPAEKQKAAAEARAQGLDEAETPRAVTNGRATHFHHSSAVFARVMETKLTSEDVGAFSYSDGASITHVVSNMMDPEFYPKQAALVHLFPATTAADSAESVGEVRSGAATGRKI